MKRILLIVAVVCFGSISAEAQYGNESMRPAAARATIDKTLTEEVVEAARPLNSKLDYIAATIDKTLTEEVEIGRASCRERV